MAPSYLQGPWAQGHSRPCLTLIFIVLGASAVISFCILSAMPGYMVVPPDSTVLAYRSFRMSTSHFMMELKVVSWMPQDSIPKRQAPPQRSRVQGEKHLDPQQPQREVSHAAHRTLTQEGGLEERLGTPEPLVANSDHLTIRQLIALLQGGGGCSSSHLLLEVQGDVAELLLDVTHNFPLGCGGKAVTTFREDLHEVVCQVPASQVQTQDGVGEGVPLVDGHRVGDPIPRVHDNTSSAARGVQRQHSLDGHIHGRSVESLEHDLQETKGSISQRKGLRVTPCSHTMPACHKCDVWRKEKEASRNTNKKP